MKRERHYTRDSNRVKFQTLLVQELTMPQECSVKDVSGLYKKKYGGEGDSV